MSHHKDEIRERGMVTSEELQATSNNFQNLLPRFLSIFSASCYRDTSFANDEERLECLFKLYEKMTRMTQINYDLSGIIIKKNPRHLRHLRLKS